MHLPFIAHTCARQMCVTIMYSYEAQTCASFYYLNNSTDQCTGQWRCECTAKDLLPDQRGSLANNIIPSHAKEQAIKSFDKTIAIHNTRQTHSN